MGAGAWMLLAALVTAVVALIGVALTAFFSFKSERTKASSAELDRVTAELDRVTIRSERYWAKIEEQQAQIVGLETEVRRIKPLEAKVQSLTWRLSQYEEVS